MPCRWVALPHARKTKLTRETCIIQNTHHVSKQHLKHLHQTIQDIQKGILRLISITLRDCQNNYSSLLKSLQSKNILKNVMLQDFMTKRSMHIKQFTEAFQWDGQSLAPRAYGGWGWAGWGGGRKTNILHRTKTMCSVNKPAIRFGLRLSCIHRNKLGKKGTALG